MIQVLRKETCSGQTEDLAQLVSADCLSDGLTKASAKPDALVKAVATGVLKNIDLHPPFRSLFVKKTKLILYNGITTYSALVHLFVSFFGEAPLSAVG